MIKYTLYQASCRRDGFERIKIKDQNPLQCIQLDVSNYPYIYKVLS